MERSTLAQQLLNQTAEWPDSWKGDDTDLPLGRKIVAAMMPFLEALVEQGVAETTLRRHFHNAWLIGSEIIRAADFSPSIPRLKGKALLLKFVEEEGGPLCQHIRNDSEQRSYDSTARKLYRFLERSE